MSDDQRPPEEGGSAEPIEPGPGWPGPGDRPTPPQFPDLGELLGPDAAETIGTVAEEALRLFAVARDRFGEALAAAEEEPGTAAEQVSGEAADPSAPGESGVAASPWAGLMAQFAAGAVKAVEDFASSAQRDWMPSESGEPVGHTHPVSSRGVPGDDGHDGRKSGEEEPGDGGWGRPGSDRPGSDRGDTGHVRPGEAAACSYCPICQGIALVRSVPPGTWQRLAVSVVELADAARDAADAAESVVHPDPGGAPPPANVVIRQEEVPAEGAGLGSVADFLDSLEPTDEPPQE